MPTFFLDVGLIVFSSIFFQILSPPPPSPSHGLCCFSEHWADWGLHCNWCASLSPTWEPYQNTKRTTRKCKTNSYEHGFWVYNLTSNWGYRIWKNGFLNGLKCILRDKDFNERGLNPPCILFLHRCLRPTFKPLAFSARPPFLNNHSGSSPFCTYISLYLVYGDVLWMIQTLICIYSCDTIKVTKKTSRWLIP